MGSAALVSPADPSGGNAEVIGNSSTITNIDRSSKGTLRPKAGSVDLAVGVGVGMCIGGAAVFVVLMTMRNRRTTSRKMRGEVVGAGFGFDGVRLHGGTGGRGRGGDRWPRRRKGFPIVVGGRKTAGAKEIAIELGRGGFDYNGDEEFAALKLDQDDPGDRGFLRKNLSNDASSRFRETGEEHQGLLLPPPPQNSLDGDLRNGSSFWRDRTRGQLPSKSSDTDAKLLGGGDEEFF